MITVSRTYAFYKLGVHRGVEVEEQEQELELREHLGD